jgi:glucose-1-phosphate adenylyltransferase
MMEQPTPVHAFVMAGGVGARLRPLTAHLCKPALPFGADHRVVDFVLANLRHSGVRRADLLVQYEPASLIQHVRQTWWLHGARDPGFRVDIAPPRPGGGADGYRGTADAVQQNLFRLDAQDDEPVLVFGADHVYRMDVRPLLAFHRATRADVTVASLPVPLAQASAFGIVETDEHGRATAFQEKPLRPRPMPGRHGQFDFGQHVLPALLATHRVMAYDFRSHGVPGLADDEEAGYWRDVGTLDAYFEAHLDTLGPSPRFRLDNTAWPLLPFASGRPPARASDSRLSQSRLGCGAVVDRAWLRQVVVGQGARISAGAALERAILMDGVVVGEGARLRQVIVDRDNVIPPGECIGLDAERDAARFPRSAGGIVVVPPGHFAAAPADAALPTARRTPAPALG